MFSNSFIFIVQSMR